MKEQWSSNLMFIIAVIGSAVGLGNIWRFPYMAGQYGSSFIVVYIISIVVLGLPIMLLEFIAGRHFSAPITGSFSSIGRGLGRLSSIFIALNMIILSYYVVVAGWTLGYVYLSLIGAYAPLGEHLQEPIFLVFTPITLLITLMIMRNTLKDGIEKANKILMPIFLGILFLMLSHSLTLPGLWEAIKFYTTFKGITAEAIAAAITQALFSLGVGTGVMLTYASHLQKGERIASSAAIASFSDTAIALIAGIAIFPIVFTYGLNPESGPALAFDTLPIAFLQMPFGNILMPLFFILLFSVALTSIISMAELLVADLSPSIGRDKAALATISLTFLLSIPSMLSYSPINLSFMGMPVLDLLDGVFVVWAYPLVAVLMVLVLGWCWDGFERESARVMPAVLLRPYIFLVKFVIPFALLAAIIMKVFS
ncbi:MAG: sodium-dependent transporter [Candidatus Anstonellales archaeon]